jgi:peptidyl-prolyl cis-trans isomerase C
MEDNKVLATVAGKEITESDLNREMQLMDEDKKQYMDNPFYREECLSLLIDMHVFEKYGEEIKADEDAEFVKAFENTKRDMLAKYVVSKKLKEISVSDDEANEYYQNHLSEFEIKASVTARHILVDTEEECRSILAKIEGEEMTFIEAAKAYSVCPTGEGGGDLGEFGYGEMEEDFEEAAFAAEVGKIEGPVKTSFGYHLIKVDRKVEDSKASFEEVKERIKKNLLLKKQNEWYVKIRKDLWEKHVKR